MHTVPVGYLEAFAVRAPVRRKPAVWRFERNAGEAKLLGVRDVAVVNDIYTILGEDGCPDRVIEDRVLVEIDGGYCAVRDRLVEDPKLPRDKWGALARFLAFQLLRTPRSFQSTRDGFAMARVPHADDDPQKLMVYTAPWIERWLLSMEWAIVRNDERDHPFVTSDEPASMWKDVGTGAEIGVGFADPAVQVTCPLTPTLGFIARHTTESLRAAWTDGPGTFPEIPDSPVSITGGPLTSDQVKRFNLVTVSNADRYVYASYNDAPLRRFLKGRFFGVAAPVRREDRKPFGSPV